MDRVVPGLNLFQGPHGLARAFGWTLPDRPVGWVRNAKDLVLMRDEPDTQWVTRNVKTLADALMVGRYETLLPEGVILIVVTEGRTSPLILAHAAHLVVDETGTVTKRRNKQ